MTHPKKTDESQWKRVAQLGAEFASAARFPDRYGTIEIDRGFVLYDNNPIAGHEDIRRSISADLRTYGFNVVAEADATGYATHAWVIATEAVFEDVEEAMEIVDGVLREHLEQRRACTPSNQNDGVPLGA